MKKLRLIELFAGYGSQALSLKNLGVDFEHHFICEYDPKVVDLYNTVHDTNFEAKDIKEVHGKDLNIIDKNKYNYIMTYSFPCTSISMAGKKEGMKKGSKTESSLLWEVERLLKECKETGLPDVLLMENSNLIHNDQNIKEFNKWIKFLDKLGYKNTYTDCLASDYGIPQNRKRCFMVSMLNKKFEYEFPKTLSKVLTTKTFLDRKVDTNLIYPNRNTWSRNSIRLITKDGKLLSKIKSKIKYDFNDLMFADLQFPNGNGRKRGSYICYTITCTGFSTLIVNDGKNIRKLSVFELGKLMGVSKKVITKMNKKFSKKFISKCFGNSIVIPILMGIFSQMNNIIEITKWNDMSEKDILKFIKETLK